MGNLIGSIVVTILAAYFLGNLNGAIIISGLLDKEDVRTRGSGNAGMTNYMRNYGLRKTGLVVLIDLGKAVLACFMGGLLLNPYGLWIEGTMLAGVMVSLGHDFPALQGFRGGKGILCGLGVALVADWRIGLLILGVFLIIVILTRYVSLGSVVAAFTLGVAFTVLHPDNVRVCVLGWVISLCAIFMHRGNIKRLFAGTERKLSFGHKEEQA